MNQILLMCVAIVLLGATNVPAENLALRDGVQIIGTVQEGARIYWRRGSRQDVGVRIRDDQTGKSTSVLLWVNPLSLIAHRGVGYYFGGTARDVTEIEIVENCQRTARATVYYDGGSQAFGPLTPAGDGDHSTVLRLNRPVDTRFVYIDVSEIAEGDGRKDIVDIRELRVEGRDITPAALKDVVHRTRGSHWKFIGSDFAHNRATIAASPETQRFTNAYNSANLMGGADSLDLDLGTSTRTSAVGINQASTLMNGDVYNRIRQAQLEFSDDADFRTVVATRMVDLDDFRTFQLLDYEPVEARHVRLTAKSLYRGDIDELGISGALFVPESPTPDLPEAPTVLAVEQESLFDPVHPGDPYVLTVKATHPVEPLEELTVLVRRSRHTDHRGRDEQLARVRLLPTGQPNEYGAEFVIPEKTLGGHGSLPEGTYQIVITGFQNEKAIGVLRVGPGAGANWGGRVEAIEFPKDTRPFDVTLSVRNRRGPQRTIQCETRIVDESGKAVRSKKAGTLEISAGQTVTQTLTVKPLPKLPWYHVEVALREPSTGEEQVLTLKRAIPTPKDTIPLERLEKLVSRNDRATYAKDRVISPPMSIAIRQEHPDRPTYQEGRSYTFLVNSMKFPKMTRLGDGRIVLMASAWLHRTETGGERRSVFVIYSDDDGETWSQPRELPNMQHRPRPVSLGGQKLLAYWFELAHSEDGGETWSESLPHPLRLENGQVTALHGTILAEGNDLRLITASEAPPHGPTGWTGYSWLWHSQDAGRTWDKPIKIPEDWHTSEGSVTRAKDGALVASFRTNQATGFPSYCDHFRRVTTARSMDNGRTWTHHQVHFNYGKVHTKLLVLRNGDILMTYAARMGELEGEMYHGIEAVLSRDHGRTWGWDRRFILFRWAMHQSMHTPDSIELADGRILTVFTYHYHASWGPGSFGASALGMTQAVFWSPYADEE